MEVKIVNDNMKEVYFDQYCSTCKNLNVSESDLDNTVCDECLGEPARPNSHKPVRYEEK